MPRRPRSGKKYTGKTVKNVILTAAAAALYVSAFMPRQRVPADITVEVTPWESQKLALATGSGTMSLALRNVSAAGDVADNPPSVTMGDLVGAPTVASRVTVKVRRGGSALSVEDVRR